MGCADPEVTEATADELLVLELSRRCLSRVGVEKSGKGGLVERDSVSR